eukprot:6704433-Pyramimonas_sp.AAC.1
MRDVGGGGWSFFFLGQVPGDLVDSPQASKGKDSDAILWRGEKDGNAVLARTVKKKDAIWLQVWHQPKTQVLQLIVEPEQMAAGKTWIVHAAEKWANGSITKAEMEADKAKHFPRKKKGEVGKRPASKGVDCAVSHEVKKTKIADEDIAAPHGEDDDNDD